MKYYLSVLKNYGNFSGRARRMEYWMFSLISSIFTAVAILLDHMLGLSFKTEGNFLGYGWIYTFYGLAVMIPGLAVLVRRLHDVGKSGWFMFIALIPIVGWIWILVLLFTDGKPGVNKYGPNPKGNNVIDIDQIGSSVS